MHFTKAEAPPRSTAEQRRTGFVKEGPGLDRRGREEEMGGGEGKKRCQPKARKDAGLAHVRRQEMKAHGDSTAHPTQVAKPQPSDPRLLARLGGPRPPTPAGGNAKCGSLRRGGDAAMPPHQAFGPAAPCAGA